MTMTLASSQSTMTDQVSDKPRLEQPDEGHWREIIGQIGTEVGLPLSAALERVTVLATTGKIDRAGLRMLREEIERARRAGMIGQQLARFASGRIRQSPEQISVTQMLREVLLQRGREATARQIEISQALKPAEIVVDATLLYALLQAVVDWSLDLAQKKLEFKLDIKAWPPYARLAVRFAHASSDASDRLTPVGTPAAVARLDGVAPGAADLVDAGPGAGPPGRRRRNQRSRSSSRARSTTRSKASASSRSTRASACPTTPSRWPAATCWWWRAGARCGR